MFDYYKEIHSAELEIDTCSHSSEADGWGSGQSVHEFVVDAKRAFFDGRSDD
jgi:hypothetical protein